MNSGDCTDRRPFPDTKPTNQHLSGWGGGGAGWLGRQSRVCVGDHRFLCLAFRFTPQPESHLITRKAYRAGRPSRALIRTEYNLGARPGQGQRIWRPSHPREKRTDWTLGNTECGRYGHSHRG